MRTIWLAEYKPGVLGIEDVHYGSLRIARILRDPLRIPEPENSVLLRWGLCAPIEGEDKVVEVFNPAKAIKLTVNKVKMKEVFLEKGVPTPRLLSHGQPLVVKDIYHRAGRGTMLLRGKYAEEFVETHSEYRVYVAFGKTLVRQKIFMGEYNGVLERGEVRERSIRSHARGWRIRYVPLDSGLGMPLREVAKKAVQALGLHVGVADVGVDGEGRYWVFEVNSGAHIDTPPIIEWVKQKLIDMAHSVLRD